MANSLIFRSSGEDRIFSRNVAAQLARITVDLLDECKRASLVRPGSMLGGGEGYTLEEIGELARIGRMQQDLGLDFDAIEIVLHMRSRMLEMLDELSLLEAQMWEREQQMRTEIHRLRQLLAVEASYR